MVRGDCSGLFDRIQREERGDEEEERGQGEFLW